MTALAASKDVPRIDSILKSYPVAASTTIYKGGGVCINTAGYAVPAANTAGFKTAGIAYETIDNSGGSAGDLNVRVYGGTVHRLVATSITQAMVGEPVYWVDDQTVDETTTEMIYAGILVEYISTTSGWIDVTPPGAEPKGGRVPFLTKTDDYTILEEESGAVFAIATDAKIFTLPATKQGLVYTFVNTGGDAGVLLTIDPATADAIVGNDLIGGDGKKLNNTKTTAKSGDTVTLVGDGDAGWWIVSSLGIWAVES